MSNKTKAFILKATAIHGDVYKYDLVEYVNANTPVSIICSTHGVFKQKPMVHLDKSGCHECGRINAKSKMKKDVLSFEEAREYVHKLKFKGTSQWSKFCKSGDKPNNIPATPNIVYKEKWISWSDWLNNGKSSNGFLSFEEAKTYINILGLKSSTDWKEYSKTKRPNNIPAAPNIVYKEKGWISWGDWFGTKIEFSGFLSFEEARKYMHQIKLKSLNEWQSYKKPVFIPSNPNRTYKDEWVSWGDWFGTNTVANGKKIFLSYDDAKKICLDLGLRGETEFRKYIKSDKKNIAMPVNPDKTYKDKWVSWGEFLDTKSIASNKRKFLSYDDAKNIIHPLNIKTIQEFKEKHRTGIIPKNIPYSIHNIYRDNGWISISDFLGNDKINNYEKNKKFQTFQDAKIFVHSLSLKTQQEWKQYCQSGQRPENIPANPNKTYSNEWVSIGDWIGIGTKNSKNRNYLTYEEAKEHVSKLGLDSMSEWNKWSKTKRPENIPSHPQKIYKNKGWSYWGDFLGTNRVASYNIEYVSYEEAKAFIKTLNIKGKKEWEDYVKSGLKPDNIPADPAAVYGKRK